MSNINQLSHEPVEELCVALERGPSVTWKALMESTVFRSLSHYTDKKVAATIKCSKDLLADMDARQIQLYHLVNGLIEIGNKKAISIIKRGSHFVLYVPFLPGFVCITDS